MANLKNNEKAKNIKFASKNDNQKSDKVAKVIKAGIKANVIVGIIGTVLSLLMLGAFLFVFKSCTDGLLDNLGSQNMSFILKLLKI